MTDKQINRWLRRRFSVIGWVLLAYYGLITLLTTLTAFTDGAKQTLFAFAAGDYSGSIDMEAVASNAWGYIMATLLFVVVLHAWKGSAYWKQEILATEKPMRLAVLLSVFCFCMGAQMVNNFWILLLEAILNSCGLSVMPILESVAGESGSFSMFLYSAIVAPLGEELVFRGYVLRSLRPYGKRFAIMGSALLFGLFHGNLLQTPYAILMGLILGYITAEYSIRWSVALHMFNNLVLAELLTRLTASWTDTAYSTLHSVLFGGSLLISLLILTTRRLEIRAWRKSEWMDRRCIRCFFTNSGVLAFLLLMSVSIGMLLFA